jgi:iron complex transport system substrate-binding protein
VVHRGDDGKPGRLTCIFELFSQEGHFVMTSGTVGSRGNGRVIRWGRALATAAATLAILVLVSACGSSSSSSGTTVASAGLPPSVPNGHYPVTIHDCGVTTTYTHAPARVVTIEESSTEFMLALGLQKYMVGTAYIDSPILPKFLPAYDKIPVLSNSSLSEELVLKRHPNLVYGAYADQFAASGGSGTRASLAKAGVDSFLSPADCWATAGHDVTFTTIWTEIRDLGEIFGVENRANALIASQQQELKQLTSHGLPFKGLKVFWYDSDTTPPYVGSCCGVPALLMRTLGATNIFASAKGSWANGNWETVVASNPNVIVFDNAEWDTTAHKEKFLAKYAATKGLTAVVHHEYIPIDFAYITPSVRNVSALQILVSGLEKLHLKS